MTRRQLPNSRKLCAICGLLILVGGPRSLVAELSTAAISAFNSYINAVESRLAQQRRSPDTFLAPTASAPQNEASLRGGELLVEQLTPAATALPGALLHHWRGTAFAPGATVADFEQLMRNFNAYPQHFSPEVIQARAITQQDDHLQAWMRIRQRHVITVVMETTYDIIFGKLDSKHGYSISRSTHVSEIDSPGTTTERTLNSSEEHGFLWRQNTYWSYEERDGGLYMQIESVSLTRSIPRGLAWAVQPFVESIPRESLDFTLRSTCNALRKYRTSR
ncbi:MAG: hypothetical protein ABSA39_10775 [Edaphobacter sp.]